VRDSELLRRAKALMGEGRAAFRAHADRHVSYREWVQEFGKSAVVMVFIYLTTGAVAIACTVYVATDPSVGKIVLSLIILAVVFFGLHRYLRGSYKDALAEEDRRYMAQDLPQVHVPTWVRQSLYSNEKVVVSYREHPISLVYWWAAGALGPLLFIGIGINTGNWLVGLLALVVIALPVGARTMAWWRDRVFITDQRILRFYGVLKVRTGVMPLFRLTDASKEESFSDRVLARIRLIWTPTGTIHVESAGQDQAITSLRFVPDVRTIFRLIGDTRTQSGAGMMGQMGPMGPFMTNGWAQPPSPAQTDSDGTPMPPPPPSDQP
jgi:hypothetical protein